MAIDPVALEVVAEADLFDLLCAVEHLRGGSHGDPKLRAEAAFRIATKLDALRVRLSALPASTEAEAVAWRLLSSAGTPGSLFDSLEHAKGVAEGFSGVTVQPLYATPPDLSAQLDALTRERDNAIDLATAHLVHKTNAERELHAAQARIARLEQDIARNALVKPQEASDG